MDDLNIGGEKFVSSKRAAEITGYAKDYIGQLCREGRVTARLVGRSWYVRESALRDHRFGPENAEPTPKKVTESAESGSEEWQSTKYVADVAVEIPLLSPKIPQDEQSDSEESTVGVSATDMQEAWQSWFSQNQSQPVESSTRTEAEDPPVEPAQEPEIEAEEHVEIRKVSRPVALETFAQEDFASRESLPIRTYEPFQAPKAKYSYIWLKLALVLVAVFSLSVAIIGTGTLEVGGGGVTAAAFDFINGSKTISK